MADREKVIKALECCSRPAIRKCKECPYESYCYHDSLCDITIHDAIALLKEQDEEVKAAYRRGLESGRTIKWD